MSAKHFSPRQACLDTVCEDADILFADGYDDAILGVAEWDGVWRVVYDVERILRILRKRDGMTRDEAEEFYAFNIAGASMGERTPVFMVRVGGKR
ncbi:MAG: hypothetical protein IPJ18_20260 [Betaproteobacteria bacterium]|nr:hypothetical protein [Betaproteobacteria bacterium]